MKPKKILIIRFSSIGDVVLTTPVIRCVKQQSNAEVHVVTKRVFAAVLNGNPHIHTVHSFEKDISEIIPELKAEKFDHVIDLHNNLRSLRLKAALKVRSKAFRKLNLRKFAAVYLKMKKLLPNRHIVDRYFDAAREIGVRSDGKGLDYFLTKEDKVELPEGVYTVLVLGGSYFTKRIPMPKLEKICGMVKGKIVLLGGKEDAETGKKLSEKFSHTLDRCGKLSIGQSAYLIKYAEKVISSDTGLMHIAAAFNRPVISLWGNTIPEFGMSPYMPHPESRILEVKDLKCRPCSKLGFSKCPKGHFHCMMQIDVHQIQR